MLRAAKHWRNDKLRVQTSVVPFTLPSPSVKTETRTDELLACLREVSAVLEARENDIALLNDFLATRESKPDDELQVRRCGTTLCI